MSIEVIVVVPVTWARFVTGAGKAVAEAMFRLLVLLRSPNVLMFPLVVRVPPLIILRERSSKVIVEVVAVETHPRVKFPTAPDFA